MMGNYGDGTDPLEQALRARVMQGARQAPGYFEPKVSTYNLVDSIRVPQNPVSEALYGTQTRHVAATDFDHAAALHAANQQAAYMTEARQAPYAQAGQQLASLLQGRAQQADAAARMKAADADASKTQWQQSPDAMRLAWAQILSQNGQPLPPGMMPPGLGGPPDPLSSLPQAAQDRLQLDPKTGLPAGTPASAVGDMIDRGVSTTPADLEAALVSRYGQGAVNEAVRAGTHTGRTPSGLGASFRRGLDFYTGNLDARGEAANAAARRIDPAVSPSREPASAGYMGNRPAMSQLLNALRYGLADMMTGGR